MINKTKNKFWENTQKYKALRYGLTSFEELRCLQKRFRAETVKVKQLKALTQQEKYC